MNGRRDDTVEYSEKKRFADSFFAPESPSLALRFGGSTHVGLVRKRNEDQFAIVHRRRCSEMLQTSLPDDAWSFHNDSAYCLFVADGVGGAARGDVASSLALQTVFELSTRATNWLMKFTDLDAQEVHERVEAYLDGIQQAFQEHVALHPRAEGMGTTLTTAVIMPPHMILVHLGDSRAYLLRQGRLFQMTRDDTLAQDLIESGADPKTVRSFRHLLTNSLSADGSGVTSEVLHSELEIGDRILLCSDGLSDCVARDRLAEILTGSDPQASCDQLIEAALATGGRDNITAVICHVNAPDSSAASTGR